jgi:nitrate/TMAO reductase-like tetraheme cytochrome c subunit
MPGPEVDEKTRKRRFSFVLVILGIVAVLLMPPLLSTQPRFCSSCHLMRNDYNAWRDSTHKEADCWSCHRQSNLLGLVTSQFSLFRMITSNITQLYEKPVVAQVSDSACLDCHKKIKKKITVRNGIKVSHKELSPEKRCTECHNTVAHGDVVGYAQFGTMDKCTDCHDSERASSECKTCHVKDVKITKRRKGPWQVVHGRTWKKSHGMGNLSSCSACHDQTSCSRCHLEMPHPSNWPYSHGVSAKEESLGECYNCHLPNFCKDCHRLNMPHNKKFLPNHPRILKEVGKKICMNCHVQHDCDDCHARHIHRSVAFPKKLGK